MTPSPWDTSPAVGKARSALWLRFRDSDATDAFADGDLDALCAAVYAQAVADVRAQVEALPRLSPAVWPCPGDGDMCSAGAEMEQKLHGEYLDRDKILSLPALSGAQTKEEGK